MRLLSHLLLLVLALCAIRTTAAPLPAKDRIVILVSLDGFPAWIWKNPHLPIPHLRKLAAEGAQAEAMTVSNPSITWINHTTLVTGVTPQRHGVLFNGLLIRGGPSEPLSLEPWRDKAELVRVPTLYDVAHRAGLKTAQVDWVAILNSGTIHHEFLEIPKPGGSVEREMAARGLLTDDDLRNWTKGRDIVWRDEMWTRAGEHIIETHRPNLLLFHLLTTDAVNHRYGPGTLASHTAYAQADAHVGRLVRALERAGLRERATFVIATDHGFKKVAKVIRVNEALAGAGLVRVEGGKAVSCDAYAMPQGGLCFVYVTDPARRAELLPRLKTMCAGIEGVAQVLDGQDGPTLGMPTPAENPGMGDLVLYAKPTYAFTQGVTGGLISDSPDYQGTHGYPSTDPELDGIFVASGYGVKRGVTLPRVRNLDVAPTIAALLGVQLPPVEGRALSEVLAE